jgi:hypothetical protein
MWTGELFDSIHIIYSYSLSILMFIVGKFLLLLWFAPLISLL